MEKQERTPEMDNVLTLEGWEVVKRHLDFLPDDDAVRENYMKMLVYQLCNS